MNAAVHARASLMIIQMLIHYCSRIFVSSRTGDRGDDIIMVGLGAIMFASSLVLAAIIVAHLQQIGWLRRKKSL